MCLLLAASSIKLASQDVRFLRFAVLRAVGDCALQGMSTRQFQATATMLLIVSGLGCSHGRYELAAEYSR